MTISKDATLPTIRRVDVSMGAHAICHIIKEDGGVIVRDLLPPKLIQRLNEEIDPHLETEPAGGRRDDDFIKDGYGRQTKRLSSLAIYSKSFREDILNQPLIHEICEKTFREESGDYWMTTATVIEIGPGNKAQPLHRDASFPIFEKLGVNAPEALINFFIPLNEFRDENGATRAIPGSHRWPDFTVAGRPEQSVAAEMRPGELFVYSGKLLHGGGRNVTKNYYRRGLSLAFQAAYLTPAEAPYNIPREIIESMTPLAQKMLAWRSIYPPKSFGLWQIGFNEMGEEIGLKSNQPLKQMKIEGVCVRGEAKGSEGKVS